MFNHVEIDLPQLERETIDDIRYYKTPEGNQQLVSITAVIRVSNRDKFSSWEKKVGIEQANKVRVQSTSRGTDMHTLVEHYIKNEQLPKVQPLSDLLFKICKPELNKIDKIHALESSLYSLRLGIAGTVDCIAEYNGELAIIDFKTSKKPKPRKWIDHYFVQAAAYACMFYELTGITVKKLVILMACEDGSCEVYEEYDKMKYIKKLSEYVKEFVDFRLSQNEE